MLHKREASATLKFGLLELKVSVANLKDLDNFESLKNKFILPFKIRQN